MFQLGPGGSPSAVGQAPLRSTVPMVLDWSPEQQARWYPAMETVFRTRDVRRGAEISPLPVAEKLIDPRWRFQERNWTVDGFMAANRMSGVLVIKDGRIVLERYGLGRGPQDRWASFSVTKSITSTLVGIAIGEGRLRLDDPVERFVPEMRGSAYQGVTVRQLLTMNSGVKWNEDYADPRADIAQAGLPLEPGVDPFVSYLRRLPRARPAGSGFHYNTAETDLMGVLLSNAVGVSLSDYASEKLWKPAGMERDAVWMIDRGGRERGGCCLSMTLGDYGRFGQLVLDDGVAAGHRLVPAGWLSQATRTQTATGEAVVPGYGYFWWILPDSFAAAGIYGQAILVVPQERLVVVTNAAWPKAEDATLLARRQAFFDAVRAASKNR